MGVSVLRPLRVDPGESKSTAEIPTPFNVMKSRMYNKLILYVRAEKPAVINLIDAIEAWGEIQLVLITYPVESLRING